ncbi:MAG: hypothetical protein ABNH21_06790 [Glaciecola sp.]|jgi:transcriptional regulator with XRE-family HTH domain
MIITKDELKNLKNKSGLTWVEIAERSGIPLGTIESWLCRPKKRFNPRRGNIEALVQTMGYETDSLEIVREQA